MSYTSIKTYIVRPKDGAKSYYKQLETDNALGYLKGSAFVNTTVSENEKAYLQNSYEHEVDCFVKRLLNGISTVTDENGEIERYVFEDKECFDEKHLLWACFDMLIKADITIKTIKEERMRLLAVQLGERSGSDNNG